MTADQLRECDLLPCPFCGGHAHWCMCDDEGCHRIECDGCKFQLDALDLPDEIETVGGLRSIMSMKWNTRPTAVASHAEGDVELLTMAYRAGFIGACQWPEPVSQDVDSPAFKAELQSFIEKHTPIFTHPPRSGDEARDAARWQAFKRYVYETVGGNHLLDRLAVLDIGAWDGCIDELQAAMAARGGS